VVLQWDQAGRNTRSQKSAEVVSVGPEKRFENKIKAMLDEHGAWYVKYFANRNTRSGIPDILACVNGEFLGIEVKSDSGHPTDLQLHHVEKIRKAGGLAFVVYPSGFEQLIDIVTRLEHGLVVKGRHLPIELK
jgi:Holliday junction resolvase